MSPPTGLANIEWLNENSFRKYPLHDDASCQDTTGAITLPNDLLVDMVLPVNVDPTIDTTLFHVLGVAVYGTGVTITLGYNGTPVGSISVDAGSFVRNQVALMTGTGVIRDSQVKLVLGSLTNTLAIPGSYVFTVAAGRLSPSVVKPDIRGVSSIVLKNGTDVSNPIVGDVVLQAGSNMLMTYIPGAGTLDDPNRIVINAIAGEGLNSDCQCSEVAALPSIKTISGIGPDNNGNFNLVGSECLKLQGIANGLSLEDPCSKPCCGCAELDVVQNTLNMVVSQLNGLENLASRLESAIAVMSINTVRTSLQKTSLSI